MKDNCLFIHHISQIDGKRLWDSSVQEEIKLIIFNLEKVMRCKNNLLNMPINQLPVTEKLVFFGNNNNFGTLND